MEGRSSSIGASQAISSVGSRCRRIDQITTPKTMAKTSSTNASAVGQEAFSRRLRSRASLTKKHGTGQHVHELRRSGLD